MTVWTNNGFDGRYPVGTAAVVVAPTRGDACSMLNDELARVGLARTAEPEQFVRLKTRKPSVTILCDGDY